MPRPARYGAVAMSLHWLIAAAIIVNILVVLLAPEHRGPARSAYMGFHMALGLTVLVLSVARLIWRLSHAAPPPIGTPLERLAAAALHGLFYVLIVAIPLAGWLMVSASGRTPSWFGLFAWPAFPGFAGLDHASAHAWHENFETIHVVLGWAMAGLIPLHIAAGFYHHWVQKDGVLLRMLPGR